MDSNYTRITRSIAKKHNMNNLENDTQHGSSDQQCASQESIDCDPTANDVIVISDNSSNSQASSSKANNDPQDEKTHETNDQNPNLNESDVQTRTLRSAVHNSRKRSKYRTYFSDGALHIKECESSSDSMMAFEIKKNRIEPETTIVQTQNTTAVQNMPDIIQQGVVSQSLPSENEITPNNDCKQEILSSDSSQAPITNQPTADIGETTNKRDSSSQSDQSLTIQNLRGTDRRSRSRVRKQQSSSRKSTRHRLIKKRKRRSMRMNQTQESNTSPKNEKSSDSSVIYINSYKLDTGTNDQQNASNPLNVDSDKALGSSTDVSDTKKRAICHILKRPGARRQRNYLRNNRMKAWVQNSTIKLAREDTPQPCTSTTVENDNLNQNMSEEASKRQNNSQTRTTAHKSRLNNITSFANISTVGSIDPSPSCSENANDPMQSVENIQQEPSINLEESSKDEHKGSMIDVPTTSVNSSNIVSHSSSYNNAPRNSPTLPGDDHNYFRNALSSPKTLSGSVDQSNDSHFVDGNNFQQPRNSPLISSSSSVCADSLSSFVDSDNISSNLTSDLRSYTPESHISSSTTCSS